MPSLFTLVKVSIWTSLDMEFQGLGERGIDIGPPIFTQKRKIEEKMSEKQLLGKLRETVQQLLEQNERAKQMAEMSSNSHLYSCILYTSPSPRDKRQSRMPSSA